MYQKPILLYKYGNINTNVNFYLQGVKELLTMLSVRILRKSQMNFTR